MVEKELLTNVRLERRMLNWLRRNDLRNVPEIVDQLQPWHFADPECEEAFKLMRKAMDEVDNTTVSPARDEAVPDKTCKSDLLDDDTDLSAESMAEQLLDLWHRRGFVWRLQETQQRATNLNCSLGALLSAHASSCSGLMIGSSWGIDDSVCESVLNFIERVEKRYGSGGKPEGRSTGLRALDSVTDGLTAGTFHLIAGTTGAGKTSLAFTMACSILRQEKRLVYSSYKESRNTIVRNLLLQLSQTPEMFLRFGDLTDEGLEPLMQATLHLSGNDLVVHGAKEEGLPGHRHFKHWKERGIRAVILDDIHLFDRRAISSSLRRILEELGKLARQHGVSVVAFCRLASGEQCATESAVDICDISETEADTVSILSKQIGIPTPGTPLLSSTTFHLDVIRNTSGPTAFLPLNFNPDLQCFENPDVEEEEIEDAGDDWR